jgi:hypothetical protein
MFATAITLGPPKFGRIFLLTFCFGDEAEMESRRMRLDHESAGVRNSPNDFFFPVPTLFSIP